MTADFHEIDLGNGKATVIHAHEGTVINAGTSKDMFYLSNQVLIAGAKSQDVVKSTGGYTLHGAIGYAYVDDGQYASRAPRSPMSRTSSSSSHTQCTPIIRSPSTPSLSR